jgi:lysozyme
MDSAKLVEELERDEGCRLKPYEDSLGILTIGIGRNLRDVGISKTEAYILLHNDIERATVNLDQYLPWWRTLDETRQRVLMNMVFNLGIHRLLDFRRTLASIQGSNFEQAAKEMLDSAWAKQVGPRAIRLSERVRTGA